MRYPILGNGVDQMKPEDITKAIRECVITQAEVLVAIAMAETWDSRGAYVDQARKQYEAPSDNDIELDDMPLFSYTDEGVWVSAWVYVRDEDVPGGRSEEEEVDAL